MAKGLKIPSATPRQQVFKGPCPDFSRSPGEMRAWVPPGGSTVHQPTAWSFCFHNEGYCYLISFYPFLVIFYPIISIAFCSANTLSFCSKALKPMKIPSKNPLLRSTALLCSLAVLSLPLSAQDLPSATTDPVGVMTFTIAGAPSEGARAISVLSVPLLDPANVDGLMRARVSSVTANTITVDNAGWTAGQFSNPATPFLVKFITGSAEGRYFLVSTSTPNTADTITIDAVDAGQTDLSTLGLQTGASGDFIQFFNCDTLLSFFGTPETSGVVGGATAAEADQVIVNVGGSYFTYFYSTGSSPGWVRQFFGLPAASNVPLRPDSGIIYSRRSTEPLSLVLPGAVPVTDRQALVQNSGVTLLSQSWPIDLPLSQLGFQDMPGWTASSSVSTADRLLVNLNGSWNTYFYNGTNWVRQFFGNPISDNVVIPAGTSILVVRAQSNPGSSLLVQSIPYNL
jgi:hypothetical protein